MTVLVVCGDNSLAYHLVAQLVAQTAGQVTVILPSKEQNYGPRIASISTSAIRMLIEPELTEAAFGRAGVDQTSTVALVGQHDADNIRVALKIHALNKGVRLVIRLSDRNLGPGIQTELPGCTVLSDTATAARSFAAAVALRNPESTYLPLPGWTHTEHVLYAARRRDVTAKHLICALADKSKPGQPDLLPGNRVEPDRAKNDLVLALGNAAAHRRGQGLLRPMWWLVDALLSRKFLSAIVKLGLLLAAGTVAFIVFGHQEWSEALYSAVLDAVGAAQPDPKLNALNKIIQAAVTLLGISIIIPLITAAVITEAVRARYPALARLRPITDHVVLVGLGSIGTRVLEELHDLGVPVLCVDRDEHAHGVPLAIRERVPIVFGDISKEKTLRDAYVDKCRAVVVATGNDVTNLATALHCRAIKKDKNLRIVPRLCDDDLAEQVQHSGITSTRSVAYLAAPAFAAVMLRHEILHTIPVEREVLLIAEVPIQAGSALEGELIHDVDLAHEVRVIAIRRRDKDNLQLLPASNGCFTTGDRPPPGELLATGDRLTVVATRDGLGQVLINSRAKSPIGT